MQTNPFMRLAVFALLIFLTGCGLPQMPGIITVSAPVPTSAALPSLTPLGSSSSGAPVLASTDTPAPLLPTAQVTGTPTVLHPSVGRVLPLALPKYVINASMDYEARTLDVQQDIDYPNSGSVEIPDMLLAVEPNRLADVFSLSVLRVDDKDVSDYSLNGQRLEWKLESPLQPGQSLRIHLEYHLALPDMVQGDPNVIRPQIFGAGNRQVNLTDWYPMVVPFNPGSGWRLADPWFYGEHLVYPLANFDVTLRFTDSATVPVIAASAPAQPVDGGVHYILDDARDFVLAMGLHMQVYTSEVEGVTISSYYYPGSEAGGQAVLDATGKALKTYNSLFGPYPHTTLAAVQGDFNDGMEFDGLYYLSNAFYNLYDGTQNNYLVMIAVHETSHQWWFGRVASDQATHPWQDEALATYCEKLFYENNYPDSVKWWWSYRIDFYNPTGMIDENVPFYGGFTPYTNAVYKQGARFLDGLRQKIGDEVFFAFLKDYAAQMDGKIATQEDFFRILREHSTIDLSALFSKYFSSSPQ